MKMQTDHGWPVEPLPAPEASRVVTWVSVASAIVFGLVFAGFAQSGIDLNDEGLILVGVSVIHLLLQAVLSFFSWRVGGIFGMLSMGLFSIFAIGVISNWRFLFWLTVSMIVSVTAITIYVRETGLKSGMPRSKHVSESPGA